jgi:hypothetical protein
MLNVGKLLDWDLPTEFENFRIKLSSVGWSLEKINQFVEIASRNTIYEKDLPSEKMERQGDEREYFRNKERQR